MSSHQGRPEAAAPPDPCRVLGIPFYWELPEDERALQVEFGLEDEGYLALDLIHGSALLGVPIRYESWPEVPEEAGRQRSFEAYYDAVATILQVAAWNGFDPHEVCNEALAIRESIFQTSLRAAHERTSSYRSSPRHVQPD